MPGSTARFGRYDRVHPAPWFWQTGGCRDAISPALNPALEPPTGKPEFDTDRLDDLVPALFWFNGSETRFGGRIAWKSLPWDALDRLHSRGLISEPRRKSYRVTLDEQACERGQALFEQWFGNCGRAAFDASRVTFHSAARRLTTLRGGR